MLKIVLINPSQGHTYLHKSRPEDTLIAKMHPPLGLGYLGAIVLEKHHKVRIIDMPIRRLSFNALKSILTKEKPDVVGVSSFTSTYPNALRCAKIAKGLGSIVIMGGYHVSFKYADALYTKAVDIVVIGEGEVTFAELLDAIENQRDFHKIKGIAFLENIKGRDIVVRTPSRERIKDLDSLPLPAYQLMDMDLYARIEAFGIITGRGCPYKCKFCSSPSMWKRKVVYRGVDKVISEIKYLQNVYNYSGKELEIFDDVFTLSQERVIELCKLISHEGINLRWNCLARVDRINVKLIRAMKKAGCIQINFGIESGSNDTLKRINKGFTTEKARKAVALCHNEGLNVGGFFIIGFPFETTADFEKTFTFMKELKCEETDLACLTPYPGTEFYENKEEEGIKIVDHNLEKFNGLFPLISGKTFQREDLAKYMMLFLNEYNDEYPG